MVNPCRTLVNRRRPSRRGAAVEYVLVIALVGVGLVGALTLLARSTKRIYSHTAAATVLPLSNPASGGAMAMTAQAPPEGGTPVTSGAPPDSSGNTAPSDSSATPPDSVNAVAGTQTVGMK
jgi:Flp pilus assembly pilin Flp